MFPLDLSDAVVSCVGKRSAATIMTSGNSEKLAIKEDRFQVAVDFLIFRQIEFIITHSEKYMMADRLVLWLSDELPLIFSKVFSTKNEIVWDIILVL